VSNLIRFMESLGGSPLVARMSVDEFVAAMDQHNVAEASRQALLNRDIQAICELENARGVMFCMIATPDGAEEQDLPEQDDVPEPGEEQREE
jgi:GGDEF domain-containing protein